MSSISSARIHARARAVAYPKSEEEIVRLINTLNDEEIRYLVVGGMSNVIFKADRYNGVLIKTDKITAKTVAEDLLTVSCGVRLGGALDFISGLQLGGIEGLYGIPGTVGGMVKQNAGAFGYEIADRFVEANCYIPEMRSTVRIPKQTMLFSYRESALGKINAVLLSATLRLVPKRREDILKEVEEYRQKRLRSQPLQHPSLGSVFKRYDGVSAGYYIDKAGLKGYSIGGARVSEKHAGFIVNTGGASAKDYLLLVEYVKDRVYSEFSIELEEEIEIIE